MELSLEFQEFDTDELHLIAGGCALCTVGSVIAGAATIGGIVSTFPVSAPVIVGGCVVGGVLGYLVTK